MTSALKTLLVILLSSVLLLPASAYAGTDATPDRDGDGVADFEDPAPDDPNRPARLATEVLEELDITIIDHLSRYIGECHDQHAIKVVQVGGCSNSGGPSLPGSSR